MKLLLLTTFIGLLFATPQQDEMRRQYQDYLRIFGKQEQPDSYNLFLENLGRIQRRNCDRFLTRKSDVELTYMMCQD
jgi:hypothetical protein